jgi:hypothetical protein
MSLVGAPWAAAVDLPIGAEFEIDSRRRHAADTPDQSYAP